MGDNAFYVWQPAVYAVAPNAYGSMSLNFYTGTTHNTVHPLVARRYPVLLSLVIPAYNEELAIPPLREALTDFFPSILCEVEAVIVNDGSSDGTLPLLLTWAQADPRIKIVHLSRNFGHQMAATAGLDHASGDVIVLIDADLQDPLPVIHKMIDQYCQGYDVVYGQRESRDGESLGKRWTAWLFYRLMRSFVYEHLPPDVGDFRLVSRNCLAALQQCREQHRFLRGMVTWIGFPQSSVSYHRAKRSAGDTKYPLRKMLAFAWTAAVSFSILPLRASIVIGFLAAAVGAEEAVRALLANWLGWGTVPGWSSLMILISMATGTLMMTIGVLGEYVGRIYEECKSRPLYLVGATMNLRPSMQGQAPLPQATHTSATPAVVLEPLVWK